MPGLSPSITFSGLASNIDWQALVDSMKNKSKEALDKTTGQQLFNVSGRKAVIANMQGQLKQFANVVSGIHGLKTTFFGRTATSSDDSIVKGIATSSAMVGSHTVKVEALANQETWMADFADADSTPVTSADGSIAITVRGQPHTIDIAAGTTLQGLADAINNAKIGVKAAVFDAGREDVVGNGKFRLTITDEQTGEYADGSYNLDIDGSGLDNNPVFANSIAPSNSRAIVDGITIERSGNVISGVIAGLVLDLRQVDANTQTISVIKNATNLNTQLESFVQQYNTLVGLMNQEFNQKLDPNRDMDAQPPSTEGRAAVRTVQSALRSAIGYQVFGLDNDQLRSLSDIGIVVDPKKDGSLKLDSSKLAKATSSENVEKLQTLLFGDDEKKITGVIEKLNDTVSGLTKTGEGVFDAVTQNMDNEISVLNSRYTKQSERIKNTADRMLKQFANLEKVLSGFYKQQSYLDSAFGTSYSQKKG